MSVNTTVMSYFCYKFLMYKILSMRGVQPLIYLLGDLIYVLYFQDPFILTLLETVSCTNVKTAIRVKIGIWNVMLYFIRIRMNVINRIVENK